MKKILILTSTEGHISIAEAIKQRLSSDYEIVVRAHKPKIFDAYIAFYQFAPALFSVPYKLAEYESAMAIIRMVAQKHFRPIIHTFFQETEPDIVISTYSFFDEIASAESMRRHIPFFSIIADPRTFHPLAITAASTNTLFFDDQAVKLAQQMSPNTHFNFMSVGWFVRQEFEKIASKSRTEVREKLKLKPDVFTLLICGGSEGTSLILKVLPILFATKKKMQIIVVCGSNKKLFTTVRAFNKLFSMMMKKSQISFYPLLFVNNLQEYIRASNLVIGKAGPNLMFECAACLTPFFAITHIHGQEDGNLNIIIDKKLGIVQEDPFKAVRNLISIMRRPSLLNKYQSSLEKMSNYNRMSGTKLTALLKANAS